jgi:hypothetical protein
MWPWIYTELPASAPQVFVRNPYYLRRRSAGQPAALPRPLLFDIKSKAMMTAAIASGELSFQDRHIDFEDYTLLASEAPRRGYRCCIGSPPRAPWRSSART